MVREGVTCNESVFRQRAQQPTKTVPTVAALPLSTDSQTERVER
jgi:hypothetical protein